jgi:hypothetical protein
MAHRPLVISAVARTPQSAAPPTLGEVDGFVSPSNIQLTETLNLPELLTFTISPSKQDATVLARFLDLASQATEVWAFCDEVSCGGIQMFAGPVLGYSPKLKGDEVTWEIRAAGLLDYLRRWRIEPDGAGLTYTGIDQATIAKGLIDYYQALTYGNYGIDTSGVSTTGVTRDRTYPPLENHLIAQRLSELAAVADGFDFSIDPITRDFIVHFPEQGTDQTGSVVIDGRSIADPSAQISAGPEDLVSEGFALGDNGLVSHAANTALRAAIGRSSFASSFSGVTVQATLDDHAQRLVDQRSTQLHDPAKTLFPVGVDWDDFGVGDTVEYSYDYGAGTMTEARRVYSRQLTIDDSGGVKIGVQLA